MNSPGKEAGHILRRLLFYGAAISAIFVWCFLLPYKTRLHEGSPPLLIDLVIHGTPEYRATITNRSVCEAILQEFRDARRTIGGSQVVGEVTLHYEDGKTDVMRISPGPAGYYGIANEGLFTVPAGRFFQLLGDGGVDISRIPNL